jgi:hypothetical protein
MSKIKSGNSSSTSSHDEDDEQQLSLEEMRDILAEIKEILDDMFDQVEINYLFFNNLAKEIKNWYAGPSVNSEEKTLRELSLRTLQTKVVSVVVDLISRDINSCNKDSGLKDFEQQKEYARTELLGNLDSDSPREKYLLDNFWSDFLKGLTFSIEQVINGKLHPSVLEGREAVEITVRIRQYFDGLLSLENYLSPVISDEKEQSGSTDQNSEKKVMEEDLMKLPDEEFLKEMNRLQNLILNSPDNRYLSVEEFDEIHYQLRKAKERGEFFTLEEEREFAKKLYHDKKIPFALNPFSAKVKDRFRKLVIPKILNLGSKGV